MPLLSKVGLNRGKSLLAIIVIYFLLAIGAVTMIVPFLMTLTTSVTNQYDLPQYNILPRFLFDDDVLFIKYLIHKYPAAFENIRRRYRITGATTMGEFVELKNPIQNHFAPFEYDRWEPAKLAVAKNDWVACWDELRHHPHELVSIVVLYPAPTTDAFRDFLRQKYMALWREQHPTEAKTWDTKAQEKAALSLLNQTYGTVVSTTFDRIPLLPGGSGRLWTPIGSARFEDYAAFVATLPAESVTLGDHAEGYQQFLRELYATLEKLNREWGTDYQSWEDIGLSPLPPSQPKQHAAWSQYVTTKSPVAFVRLEARPADVDYQRWLLGRYGSLERINAEFGTQFQSAEAIHFPDELPVDRKLRLSWVEFAALRIPAANWKFPNPLQRYHDLLRRRHGTIENLSAAYGQRYTSFDDVRLPQTAFDRAKFLAARPRWRWFFLTDNFVQVFRYVAVRGRALWNTVILVGASLIAALTVNPFAAYALSRFRLRWSRALLILFLVPMAFPAEVAQIPSFILTRDFGLLNTYWALILPGLANGFSIFLLKGFFDGLPRELYEAASLDGASELQMYRHVTYPLCKPILALTVLGVVISAYSGFMWAFIVCPDEKMWTLAVWVFQFSVDAAEQGRAHQQMAALVLMSIPTLLIFLFTQKIIMKGIVLPTMK